MTSTQTRTVSTRTVPNGVESPPRPRRPRATRTGILLAVAGAVVVALAVVALAFVVLPGNNDAEPAAPPGPGPSASAPSVPPSAYLPGGSVYEQQVPEFHHWALAYGPGGSVYKSQVPHGR